MNQSISTAEWINIAILAATVVAIVLGPIVAVWMTRAIDSKREGRQRKLMEFRVIMQTRSSRLSLDHVRALNSIPVEFYGVEPVMEAFRSYIRHLNAPLPAVDDQQRFLEEREDTFLDLVYQIGLHLGYQFDRREIGRLAYSPVAYFDDEQRNKRAQAMLGEILEGRRAFPVTWVAPAGAANPFPPPPNAQQKLQIGA